MARNTLEPHPPARRSLQLAIALAVCCLLSLAFISTAGARREHTKPPPAQPAPAETSTPAASGQTGTATAPAETSAAGASGKAGGSGQSSSGQGSSSQGSSSQGNGGQGGSSQGHGSQNHGRHEHHSSGSSNSSTGTGTGTATQPASNGQESTSTPAAATTETAAEAQTKHKKLPKRPKEPKGKGKGKSGKGSGGSGESESEGESESGTGTGSEESTRTDTPSIPRLIAPTLTATAAAEPAATATVTATPAATGIATAASSRSARAAHHAKATRPRAKVLRTGVGASRAAAAAPLAAPFAAGSHQTTARLAHKASNSTRAAKRQSPRSPLVTTITHIVGVVPVAVRMLIAALLGLALLLALRSRVAALRARHLERQRVQLLEDVGLLQAALLPVPPARLGPVGTSVAYQPAAGPGAGGDFYDVFALADGQLAVIVGDVSGHGREALPHTALVRYTLRAYLEAGMSPRDAVQTAGAVLERQLGGVFATVVVATYQPRERVLVYASAGHPPPVVLGSSAAVAPITVSASPPIGVGMRTGTRQTVVSIPGRAQICFYTDGLTEARVGSELFGTERLLDTLAELGPAASASALLEQVAELADARPDDMAACLLSIAGDERAPVLLVDELELDRDEALGARTERFLLACGVERHEVAETMRAASAAAARSSTVVLELRHTDGPPEVTLQREQIAYLHARRADMEVAL